VAKISQRTILFFERLFKKSIKDSIDFVKKVGSLW